MDTLPAEIVTHILCYSSAEDVIRFKQLNSICGRILTDCENKRILPLPSFCLVMYDMDSPTVYFEITHLVNGQKLKTWRCFFNYKQKEFYTIALKPSGAQCRSSANPFVDETFRASDLQNLFAIVLKKSKLQIDLYSVRTSAYIIDLTETVRKSPSQIEVFTIDPDKLTLPEVSELLSTASKCTKRSKGFPELRIRYNENYFHNFWSHIAAIEDMTQYVSFTSITSRAERAIKFLSQIVEEWAFASFPRFSLNVRLTTIDTCLRVQRDVFPRTLYEIEFEMEKLNGLRLMSIQTEETESYVRLIDKRTKNAIQFTRIQTKYTPYREGVEDDVLIAITTNPM